MDAANFGASVNVPGCCHQQQQQFWRPHPQLPTCRICLRPVLPALLQQQQQQQLWSSAHRDGRSCFSLSRSPPTRDRRHRSPGSQSLRQRSPGAVPRAILQQRRRVRCQSQQQLIVLPPHPHPWIGEETKRQLPRHVYKYYLAQTREHRRQVILPAILRISYTHFLQVNKHKCLVQGP
ncbi:hypothetical protein QAD02_017933 [Eretmocerus hayati]|uniref:Uncharacterized protein n=1 Tax=Eretmocerus hayati TaxID=131215 RepID=A0ACC2PGI2_9HYME|nr:hypothetical protein QAD02_017933 [Eretmocerus hayati]